MTCLTSHINFAREVLRVLVIVFFFLTSQIIGAQNAYLAINEISQGQGFEEYIEFVVVGTPLCGQNNCKDLRGIIVDDNNGNYASGSGTGIAKGAIRFANDAFWSCVPFGTIIVLYNDAEQNPAVSGPDFDASDFTLSIPVSSSYLEGHQDLPSASSSNYASVGWMAGQAMWSFIGMSNSNDSFQVIENGQVTSSVSWGNNSGQINFVNGASGAVFSQTSNDPSLSTSWQEGTVGNNESAGSANSQANQDWIEQMKAQVGQIQVDLLIQPTCANTCDGQIDVFASGGASPYVFSWQTGQNSDQISGLCVGTYQLKVIDALGCELDTQIVLSASFQQNIQMSVQDVSCQGGDGQICIDNYATYTGAFQWQLNQSNSSCLTGLSAGNYTLEYTDDQGCEQLYDIPVQAPQSMQINSNVTGQTLCANQCDAIIDMSASSSNLTFQWSDGAQGSLRDQLCTGTYQVTVQDDMGCTYTESFVIQQAPEPTIDFLKQGSDCNAAQGEICIDQPNALHQYQWNTGETSACISALNQGQYDLTLTDAYGCTHNFKQEVELLGAPSQTFSYSSDQGCAPHTFQIISSNPTNPLNVVWALSNEMQENADASITIHTPGTYQLNGQITENGCIYNHQIQEIIQVSASPSIDFFTQPQLTNPLDHELITSPLDDMQLSSALLLINGEPADFSFQDPIVSFDEQGTYTLCLQTENDQGCLSESCDRVFVDKAKFQHYLPNAFSPNQDDFKYNEYFEPVFNIAPEFKRYSFVILDRWGNRMFESNDANQTSWDGTYQGNQVAAGVYLWQLDYFESQSKSASSTSGKVLVIR